MDVAQTTEGAWAPSPLYEPAAEAEPIAAFRVEAPPMPSGAAVSRATVGFLVLGGAAGLGSGALSIALQSGPSVLFVGLGTLLLTGPALVVVHQYLGLRARPLDVLGALVRGFVAGGGLALGLSPFMLFFAATTGLWLPVLVLTAFACAALTLVRTGVALLELERTEGVSPSAFLQISGLVAGWSVLTGAIGVRLVLELLSRVVFLEGGVQ